MDKYRVVQFVFYKTEDKKRNHLPINTTVTIGSKITQISQSDKKYIEYLQDGTIFENYMPAFALAITAPPGTKFYLNKRLQSPIEVDDTGIFQVDFRDTLFGIEHLQFNSQSLAKINESNLDELIIDIIYKEKAGGGEK